MAKIDFSKYLCNDYPGYETFAKEVLQPIFGDYYIPEAVAEDFLQNNNGYKATERANIQDIKRVATIEPTDGNANFFPMDVYDITVSDHSKLSRSRVGIQKFIRSNSFYHAHALMIFHYETPQGRSWRFSYFYKGETLTASTNAKRYTYLFGKNEKVRTANQRFNTLLETFHKKDYVVTDGDIEKTFSVEKLSDEFFDKYLAFYVSFVKFITGKKDSKEDKKTGINSATFRNTLKMIEAFGKHDEEDQYHKYFMPKCQNDEEVCDKRVRDYVKKMMGRLVFLHFLQRKGWMCGDRDFMKHLFEQSEWQNDFLDRVLEPLFFAVLNTHPDKRKTVCKHHNDYPYNKEERVDWDEQLIEQWLEIPYLNGGLFEQERIDECRTKFPKEYFQALFNFFDEYNFTIDENDPHDAIVGVDPEMLSKIFENLLEDNNDKGAFYTPKTIVHYMCTESLIAYLKEKCKDTSLTENDFREFVLEPELYPLVQLTTEEQRMSLSNALINIRVCDPAIGSGAFPMGMLNCIYACRHELEPEKTAFDIKLHIIQNNIFGVDIEQGAVDIARLRFWLALVVDEETPHALPNLDYRIVRGNSLLTTFNGEPVNLNSKNGQNKTVKLKKQLAQEQKEYYTLSGEEKLEKEIKIKSLILDILETQLGIDRKAAKQKASIKEGDVFEEKVVVSAKEKKAKKESQELAAKKQQLINEIGKIKSKLDSADKELFDRARTDIQFFDWKIMFSEVFDNNKGFDVVIGNPPYIQLQNNDGILANLYENQGFSTFSRKGDIYCLFYEQGYNILKSDGLLCYITSNKWMRTGYGEDIRKFFVHQTNPIILVDFADVEIFKNATVCTNILLFGKANNQGCTLCLTVNKQNEEHIKELNKFVQKEGFICSFTASLEEKSWVILSPIEQSIKSKIEAVGKPLKDWDIHIYRGVLTGYNDAFIIDTEKREQILANCQSEDERKRTAELIRPILRGRDIKRYGYNWAGLWLINTHNGIRGKLDRIHIEEYPALKSYLTVYSSKLAKRSDKGDTPYNLRNCAYLEDFSKPKIVWGNLNLKASFAIVEDNSFINAPANMIVPASKTLLAILNSKLADYYIRQLGVTRNGGYFEYKPMFIEQLPVAELSKETIEKLSVCATCHNEKQIDEILYNAYGLNDEEIKFINANA